MTTSIYTVQSLTNTIYNTDYGIDISVTNDIPSIFSLVSGPTLLANAAYRRTITPLGALSLIGGDSNYGIGAYAWLNSEITPSNVFSWQQRAITQYELDERINQATCVIDYDNKTSTLTMNVGLFPFIGQPFNLIIPIQNITAQQLLGA